MPTATDSMPPENNSAHKASPPQTIDEYLNQVQEKHTPALRKLHTLIMHNLPKGYEAGIEYGMIYYFVPHSLFPDGYHADPTKPLGLMALASQKNYISVYHLGLYSNRPLLNWFEDSYQKTGLKLRMGKSCIRFTRPDQIPYDLIAQLASKLSVQEFIDLYQTAHTTSTDRKKGDSKKSERKRR